MVPFAGLPRLQLAVAVCLVALSTPSALAGNSCGSGCSSNRDCTGFSCTLCGELGPEPYKTCIKGYPCGSSCKENSDCDANSCALCVEGLGGHKICARHAPVPAPVREPVPLPVPVPVPAPAPVPVPPPKCKDHNCEVAANCTGLGLGCAGCGADNRCHGSGGFCGHLCENSTQCAGDCSDCHDFHCRQPPAPVPPKCSHQTCKDSLDCIAEGGRTCSICGQNGKCHSKGGICGAACETSSQCTGVDGSDCGVCHNGKCTGSTCGVSCTSKRGVLDCTTPGCNYCNTNGTCGAGPGACGLKCNDRDDCEYPCSYCVGYPAGGHELQCVGPRNVCYHPCRDSDDCQYPCGECNSITHQCVGPSNICSMPCKDSDDCQYPCSHCETAVGKCISTGNVTNIN